MGRSQVATLVALHASQDMGGPNQSFHIGFYHPRLRGFIVAVRGLQERGLVLHHSTGPRQKCREIFQVTEAGEHVVALLQLSGVYQELESEFRAHDAERMAERKRA
jgi:hypothetical protein